MDNTNLSAISPVDGRYRKQVDELSGYFSEYALIKYRVYIELEYFIALAEIPLPSLSELTPENKSEIRRIFDSFSLDEAVRVKNIEKVTNHDVKAVEYFIKEEFEKLGLEKYSEFIHFGLTSQDINNTAVPLSLSNFFDDIYYPQLEQLLGKIEELTNLWADIPMLARTHGQPASPTRLGKEFKVFLERIKTQKEQLMSISCPAKFGGATGNFNAHHVAYPSVNWVNFADNFVNNTLNLQRSKITTQIEHYDNLAAIFDAGKRINTILLDMSKDIWSYISMDYFKQTIKKGEVGSSAMPHKVNPIDFENAEGNLGIANALFEHLSAKLPISRLQRDLTDSTVLRNIGVPFAHTVISFKSILKGLDKINVNEVTIKTDLESNWIVISEAIQTVLRREGFPKPYEALKDLTRVGEKAGRDDFLAFIDTLNVEESVKAELRAITPFNYTGINF